MCSTLQYLKIFFFISNKAFTKGKGLIYTYASFPQVTQWSLLSRFDSFYDGLQYFLHNYKLRENQIYDWLCDKIVARI